MKRAAWWIVAAIGCGLALLVGVTYEPAPHARVRASDRGPGGAAGTAPAYGAATPRSGPPRAPAAIEPEAAPATAAASAMSIPDCAELGHVSAELLASYPPDAIGSFELSVIPDGELHVNEEFPTSLRLSAPDALHLADRELGPERARSTSRGLAFDVSFRPERSGAYDVSVLVDYALCGDRACLPSTCRLRLTVQSA